MLDPDRRFFRYGASFSVVCCRYDNRLGVYANHIQTSLLQDVTRNVEGKELPMGQDPVQRLWG